jgi:hypothetical protein
VLHQQLVSEPACRRLRDQALGPVSSYDGAWRCGCHGLMTDVEAAPCLCRACDERGGYGGLVWRSGRGTAFVTEAYVATVLDFVLEFVWLSSGVCRRGARHVLPRSLARVAIEAWRVSLRKKMKATTSVTSGQDAKTASSGNEDDGSWNNSEDEPRQD